MDRMYLSADAATATEQCDNREGAGEFVADIREGSQKKTSEGHRL